MTAQQTRNHETYGANLRALKFNMGQIDERPKAMTGRISIVTSPYERSHGKCPRGEGSWAFQRTTSNAALTDDLYGKIEFWQGSLGDAMKKAQEFFADQFGPCDITIALLP
jgi:hypothetical protein